MEKFSSIESYSNKKLLTDRSSTASRCQRAIGLILTLPHLFVLFTPRDQATSWKTYFRSYLGFKSDGFNGDRPSGRQRDRPPRDTLFTVMMDEQRTSDGAQSCPPHWIGLHMNFISYYRGHPRMTSLALWAVLNHSVSDENELSGSVAEAFGVCGNK